MTTCGGFFCVCAPAPLVLRNLPETLSLIHRAQSLNMKPRTVPGDYTHTASQNSGA